MTCEINPPARREETFNPPTQENIPSFWLALGRQQEWLTEPLKVFDDPIYMMRTQPGFIFDDAFWETFQSFPFKVCHVAYYGAERLEDEDRHKDTGIFELRFAPNVEAK